MIKTVATTAGVNTVTFPEFFKYFWIKNTGDTTVYASAYSNVSAGVDNTCVINSGDAVCIENVDNNSVYISGAGSVEIHAQDIPDCSFKAGAKGGGSGGSGGGLTLLGTYEIPNNTQITLGTTEDIPEGTKLMFERIPTESATNTYSELNAYNSYLRYFGYVPFLSSGSSKAVSGFFFNSNGGTANDYMQIYRTSTNDIYVFTNGMSNTWNIYKLEV